MKTIKQSIITLLVLSLFGSLGFANLEVASATSPGYEYYVEGNPEDVATQTSSGLLLMGGSTDVDSGFQWMIQKSGGGDFLVLRASGTDAYNPWIYNDLGGVDSAETIIITKERAAFDPFVIDKIRSAEALFIAGGNQWNYVRRWKGTPVEDAIHEAAQRGVPVGGTSAGLAILGEYAFSAQRGTITSREALKNPYQPRITLTRDFLHLPYLDHTITDSHFAARNRMGRLVTFLARILQDGWATEARGIGIDEKTALAVEADGMATLHGTGSVYFLRTTTHPQVCQQATPLTFLDVAVTRLSGAGSSFNLSTWAGATGTFTEYSLSAVEGVLYSTQSGGGIY